MAIDVNVINPFLKAAVDTSLAAANITLTIGKPFLRELTFSDDYIRIILGVTGAMSGQVIISMRRENAMKTASNMMMGMPVTELDEMAISAISELGNMIMGSAATILYNAGTIIDITPPIVEQGTVYMNAVYNQNVCIPLLQDGVDYMELNVIVKKEDPNKKDD